MPNLECLKEVLKRKEEKKRFSEVEKKSK